MMIKLVAKLPYGTNWRSAPKAENIGVLGDWLAEDKNKNNFSPSHKNSLRKLFVAEFSLLVIDMKWLLDFSSLTPESYLLPVFFLWGLNVLALRELFLPFGLMKLLRRHLRNCLTTPRRSFWGMHFNLTLLLWQSKRRHVFFLHSCLSDN